MPDPVERLTNLVALLLETRVPLSLEAISQRLSPPYPAGRDARHAAFERDKASLKSAGIPLTRVTLTGDEAGAGGYWIKRSEYELDDLGLTEDERFALEMAVATVRLGATWADEAILKLGWSVDEASASTWVASLGDIERVPELCGAAAARRVVEFDYRSKTRTFDVWGLSSRTGFWYVVGHDRVAGEQRIYRVDRIEGAVRVLDATASSAPEGFDPRSAVEASIENLGGEDRPAEALVLVDADRADSVVRELGDDSVVERRVDGSVAVRVPCRNPLLFRAWVLGFVEHAEVLGPPEVRKEIVDWLEAMVQRG